MTYCFCSSSDFLTNLLVLLLRVLNCGLSDSGLLAHLSEATAGSLSGIGHSTAYEELSTFSYVAHFYILSKTNHPFIRLAVDYLFLTNNGFEDHPELTVEYFNASNEMNDYEVCCDFYVVQVFSMVVWFTDSVGSSRFNCRRESDSSFLERDNTTS